jgi:predicted permease
VTRPPRLFEWLLRRALPPGQDGDAIRGDLLEELLASGDGRSARRRYRRHAISIALRYAFHPPPPGGVQQRSGTMETLVQTFRFALRSLIKRPAFALTVVATLALGIGANTAIFSILHALVLRTLPVAEPERLVVLSRNQLSMPYPLFRHFQDHATTLEGLLAFRTTAWRLTAGGATERISGALVSGSYFQVLGVRAALGTTIGPQDDVTPGAGGARGPVAVLSHGFWQRRFAGQAGVIGSPIILNGRPFTVVGVAPPGFAGTEIGQSPDVFAPMAMQPVLLPDVGNALAQPRNNWLRMIGRLGNGMDVQQAELELTALLEPYVAEILKDPVVDQFGPNFRRNMLNQRMTLLPGSAGISGLRARYSKPLMVLMTVMALVLLIACANIANLSLGRAAARRKEIAIRLGLGASRTRVVGQLLSESLMLAVAGGAAGLLLARWGRDMLLTYLPVDQSLAVSLDRNVLLFTTVVTVTAAVVFGLAPAFQGARVDVAPVLKGGWTSKSSRVPLNKLLVMFQVTVSLVVVIGAVLFLRSLSGLLAMDTGFARANVLVASVDVPSGRFADLYPRLMEELKRLPGVMSVALADSAPLGTNIGWNIYIPGYVPKANEPTTSPWVSLISPGYFETMQVPVMLGRAFDDRDLSSKRSVMIVNETFARHYFGTANAVGRQVGLAPGASDIEIVGVVKDGKYTGLREQPVRMVYVPYRPGPWSSSVTIHLRTLGDPMGVTSALRQKVAEVEPQAPVSNIRTVEDEIGRSLLRERLVATITALFGALALALAAIGLYGVLSYGVAERTRELGIRIAIGATRQRILWLVLREAGWVLGLGIAAGLGSAWALGRVVSSLLFGIAPTDPVSIGIAIAVLGSAGALAAWIPARRASKIDPIRALRYE